MDKELTEIFIRNHTFNTIYVQRFIWEHIPDYYPGLIGVQYYAIIVLNCVGECKVTELAEILGIKESTATKLLNKLESLNLIKRRSCSKDRRVTFVSLTDECIENINRCHSEGAGLLPCVCYNLSEKDLVEIAECIVKINEIFEKSDDIGPLKMMKEKGRHVNDISSAKAVVNRLKKAYGVEQGNKEPGTRN